MPTFSLLGGLPQFITSPAVLNLYASHAVAQFMDVYGLANIFQGYHRTLYIQVHSELRRKDGLIII